ncbi:hypothetical protein [Phycicoccus sp. Soil748]|uniref:hypothetical protein n=1 Tax=Phycicoccus sp. Soil748 TaxID=1736397 RepID=UPI000B3154CA|nr:hypothetical protein [Phycicoccus sp. Soil748]
MGEPLPLTRGGRVARVVGLVALWAVWVVVATAWLVLSGVAGEAGAWRWSAVAYVPLALPTWGLVRRLRHRRPVAVGMALVIWLLVWGVPAQATPGFGRVEAFADEWGAPPGATFLGQTSEGNDWCFGDGCPTVVRYYAVDDAAGAVSAVDARLRTEGWQPRGLAHGPAWCKGDFHVSAWKPPATWGPVGAHVAPVPPGAEVVELRVGANCL